MRSLVVFLALQVADFASTFIVIRLGGGEQNPLVRQLMGVFGLMNGLLIVKTLIMIAATAMILAKRYRVVRIANTLFALVVLGNATISARLLLRVTT